MQLEERDYFTDRVVLKDPYDYFAALYSKDPVYQPKLRDVPCRRHAKPREEDFHRSAGSRWILATVTRSIAIEGQRKWSSGIDFTADSTIAKTH